jgi:hypothetical protein
MTALDLQKRQNKSVKTRFKKLATSAM